MPPAEHDMYEPDLPGGTELDEIVVVIRLAPERNAHSTVRWVPRGKHGHLGAKADIAVGDLQGRPRKQLVGLRAEFELVPALLLEVCLCRRSILFSGEHRLSTASECGGHPRLHERERQQPQ